MITVIWIFGLHRGHETTTTGCHLTGKLFLAELFIGLLDSWGRLGVSV